MGNEFQLISTDAQRALEEFSMEFAAALTQPGVAPWARNLGLHLPAHRRWHQHQRRTTLARCPLHLVQKLFRALPTDLIGVHLPVRCTWRIT